MTTATQNILTLSDSDRINLEALVPSNCVACGLPLTDAVSVNRGIGPKCSQKYYDLDVEVTAPMVQKAMGVIAVLDMDGTLPSNVVEALVESAKNPRTFANVLIKWLATEQSERKVILACAPALREMGFNGLADRLVRDRAEVRVLADPDGSRLWFNTDWNFRLDQKMKRFSKTGRGPKGFGNRTGYWVKKGPDCERAMILLGIFCGGQKGIRRDSQGSQKTFVVEHKTWADLKALNAPPTLPSAAPVKAPAASGLCRIVKGNGYVQVYTPYNNNFVQDLKTKVEQEATWRDRRWNPAAKCWEVDEKHLPLVKDLIVTHYGESPAIS